MFAIAYGENEFMLFQMKGLVWGKGQALLRSPRGRNVSRDGLVKLGWVLGLQLFQNPLSLYYNLMNFYKRFKKIQFLFTFDVKRSRTKWF